MTMHPGPCTTDAVYDHLLRWCDTHEGEGANVKQLSRNGGWQIVDTSDQLGRLVAARRVVRDNSGVYRPAYYTYTPPPEPVAEPAPPEPKPTKAQAPPWPPDEEFMRTVDAIYASGEVVTPILEATFGRTDSAVQGHIHDACLRLGRERPRRHKAMSPAEPTEVTTVPADLIVTATPPAPSLDALLLGVAALPDARPVPTINATEAPAATEPIREGVGPAKSAEAPQSPTAPMTTLIFCDGADTWLAHRDDVADLNRGDHWPEKLLERYGRTRYRLWYCHSAVDNVRLMIPLDGVTLTAESA